MSVYGAIGGVSQRKRGGPPGRVLGPVVSGGVPGGRCSHAPGTRRDDRVRDQSFRADHDPDMLGSIGRRLRIALRQPRAAPAGPPDEALAEAALPEVEFVAYAEDCRLSGRIRLETERLSDMLNLHDEYELRDVLAESIETGEGVEVREIILSRDDLLLVHATG